MLRVLPAELGEVGVAADAVLEVVLGLAVAREVDGLGLGVQVHHEGHDRRGEVAAHVVRDVALPVVLVDLHDAVHRVFLLLQVVVAKTSRRHDRTRPTCSSGIARGSRSPSWLAGGRSPCTRLKKAFLAARGEDGSKCR